MNMKATTLKNLVGFFLVFLHLLAWFLCYKWLKPRLEYEDFRITVLILAPVVTIYAVAFAKDVIRAKNIRPSTETIPGNFAALAIIYAVAFGIAVIYQIYDFSTATNMTPNELKDGLALTEVIGGGIFGLFMDELFGKQEPPKPAEPVASTASSGIAPESPQS
jgi:hypothetical protein